MLAKPKQNGGTQCNATLIAKKRFWTNQQPLQYDMYPYNHEYT